MKRPTKQEIEQEIADLKEIKPRVRRTSMFGDNHHDAIDAQVTVLSERLTDDEIDERAEEDDWADNVRDEAVSAAAWMRGEYEDYPSLVDAWKELAS